MLTLDRILATARQMASYGEGQHRFGGGKKPPVPVPRDTAEAAPPPRAKEADTES